MAVNAALTTACSFDILMLFVNDFVSNKLFSSVIDVQFIIRLFNVSVYSYI